jgi:hypothetical protein
LGKIEIEVQERMRASFVVGLLFSAVSLIASGCTNCGDRLEFDVFPDAGLGLEGGCTAVCEAAIQAGYLGEWRGNTLLGCQDLTPDGGESRMHCTTNTLCE